MLNELILGRMKCPVCGRYFFGDLKMYWCPYCGINSYGQQIPSASSTKDRITSRDENSIAVYIGEHSFKNKTYAPYLNEYAISEILERLCELEEEKEENEYLQSQNEP